MSQRTLNPTLLQHHTTIVFTLIRYIKDIVRRTSLMSKTYEDTVQSKSCLIYLAWYTGRLRYLKLGCLEYPTYVEVISHSRASLPICYCISTLLVSNSVMAKTRLCRSDNSIPTEKNLLVSPCLCRTLKSKIIGPTS